ncbi:UbiX family flavin prenyltransferase [Desulfotomaculum copahuensis]|uniref:Flavin prenyltransferase UbiX n=1 Tax=Desulfotomaculum copahuensis TaxID=1838280 RepID=A0A1B7LHN1_9FIRM|nr:UbiX family flavin prenyltransferase [Desulfotomaculum copahuensis]OAT85795.1 aromatic acid decarboxylase [Desulfotomaculum copahuensis]
MRIVLAMCGASGAVYGLTLLQALRRLNVETHLILSSWAEKTLQMETTGPLEQVVELADYFYPDRDLSAPVASGSFIHQGMIVAPCSMKTLSAIANGYADNLVARAADVTIKEKRPLVLMPRESPLSAIHLENMLRLARLGVIIAPPVPSFYQRPQSIQDLVDQTAGRVLDLLGIANTLVQRWGGGFEA